MNCNHKADVYKIINGKYVYCCLPCLHTAKQQLPGGYHTPENQLPELLKRNWHILG